jgi:hypothetical protein
MADNQSWDPMDPNSKPPIRKPGELWLFVLGIGWVNVPAEEVEKAMDDHLLHGDPTPGKEPVGIFNPGLTLKGSWVTPPLPPMDPNAIVEKIKADWMAAAAPHLDPLWMVKAMGIPLGYCARPPRYWSGRDIFYALGSDAPVVRIVLGDPGLVAAELTGILGDTSPLPELRAPIAPVPAPWTIPEDAEPYWSPPTLPPEE